MIDTFAFYFPQFYPTAENSAWWGDGFTDWHLVKNASPQFSNHNQPRVPVHGYLDQSLVSTLKHQAELAVQHGICGFNFYHYWFNGHPYLDIPLKNLLSDRSIDIKFMMTWANESWTRQWIGKPNNYLIRQEYYKNEATVAKHYHYLSQFFKDSRYYKIDNKPVLCIYRPELIPSLHSVTTTLNELAKNDGFDGIYLIACRSYDILNAEKVYSDFNSVMNFNPRYAINFHLRRSKTAILEKLLRRIPEYLQSRIACIRNRNELSQFSYTDFLKVLEKSDSLINNKPVYHSVFPDWDNTPRYGQRATLFTDVNPEAYRKALQTAIQKISEQHHPLLFINAWNEWSESAYLEPDSYQRDILLAITKDVLSSSGK